MAKRELAATILKYLAQQQAFGRGEVSRMDIATALGASPPTVLRYLNQLRIDGKVAQSGSTTASRYGLAAEETATVPPVDTASLAARIDTARPTASPSWSVPSQDLLVALDAPLGARKPVSYQRSFVDDYRPRSKNTQRRFRPLAYPIRFALHIGMRSANW